MLTQGQPGIIIIPDSLKPSSFGELISFRVFENFSKPRGIRHRHTEWLRGFEPERVFLVQHTLSREREFRMSEALLGALAKKSDEALSPSKSVSRDASPAGTRR